MGKQAYSSSLENLIKLGQSYIAFYFSIVRLLLLGVLLFSSKSDSWSPRSIETLFIIKWKYGSVDSRRPIVSS